MRTSIKVLSGASQKCIAAIHPKSNSDCSSGTVTVLPVFRVGLFCHCGCREVGTASTTFQTYSSTLRYYQSLPQLFQGQGVQAQFAKFNHPIKEKNFKKESGSKEFVEALEKYKAMNKDATIDQFIASEFNPCPGFWKKANDICNSCSSCAFIKNYF